MAEQKQRREELENRIKDDMSQTQYRYGIRDPSNQSQYFVNTADEMIAKANEFGATQVKGYTADGQIAPINKVGDQWVRDDGKTLAEIQINIDKQAVSDISNRSQLRAKVEQVSDYEADKKLAFADATAFMRIQNPDEQKRAAAAIAGNSREYPDYKNGLEIAYSGYARNPPKMSDVAEKIYTIDRETNQQAAPQERSASTPTRQPGPQESNHSFTVMVGNKAKEFTDAKKAGAAYFAADLDKKPSVVHAENNRGRVIASTEIHGTYDDGQPRYFKSLPDVLPVDKEFQAGFYGALEKSVKKRLQTLSKQVNETQNQQHPPKLDDRLAADLERFANVNQEKAMKVWLKTAPEGMAVPAYLENPTMGQNVKSDLQRDIGARKVIETTGYDLMAIPKDALDTKTAQEVVRDDLAAFSKIENKAERQIAANAMGHSANEQAAYRSALQQQNPDIAKEAEAEFANTLRRNTSAIENVIAFYDRSQEKAAAPTQQTPPIAPEQTGDSQANSSPNQAANQDVPERVAARYLRLKNQYYFQDKTLAFEDNGKKLKLETENVTVIRDALTIAESRNWQAITVSGTDNFKQQVWREAMMKGIEVVGYKPTELEQVEALKAMAVREEKAQASNGPQGKTTSHQNDGIINGTLLAHGADHYKHDKNEKGSYFVKLNVDGQERTFWGVDLERAVNESETKVAIGDDVKIKNIGQRDVTVIVDVLDAQKNKIGTEEKEVKRNSWLVEKAASFDEILKKDGLSQTQGATQEPFKNQANDKNSVDQQYQPSSAVTTNQPTKIKQQDGLITGKLLAHGADHYKHDPEQSKSYYVKLDVDGKEVTKWGADFKRAFKDSHSKPEVGETVVLSNAGKQPVAIPTNERDAEGNLVGDKKTVQKNVWRIEKASYHDTLQEHAEALRTGNEIEKTVMAQMPQVASAIAVSKLGEKIAQQAMETGALRSQQEVDTMVYLIREGLSAALKQGKHISTPEIQEQGKHAAIDANNVLNDHRPPEMVKTPPQQDVAITR